MQISPGMLLVIIGAVLVVAGLVVMTGLFDWFGRLPGDIRIERDDTRIHIPITSMVIVSIALTLVIQVIARFFR